jgi:hypothetical protein
MQSLRRSEISITGGVNRRKASVQTTLSHEGALLEQLCNAPSGLKVRWECPFPPVDTGGYRHFAPAGQAYMHALLNLQSANAPRAAIGRLRWFLESSRLRRGILFHSHSPRRSRGLSFSGLRRNDDVFWNSETKLRNRARCVSTGESKQTHRC